MLRWLAVFVATSALALASTAGAQPPSPPTPSSPLAAIQTGSASTPQIPPPGSTGSVAPVQAPSPPDPTASASAPAAATSAAHDGPPDQKLRWPEDRPKFRIVEYAGTAAVGGTAIAMYFWVPPQAHPHWIGGILFDNAVRNALRLRTAAAQQTAWAFSDAVDVGLVALVFGLDSLVIPTLRGSPDVALQLGLMDAEAYAFSSVVAIGLYDSVGRARPSYEDCQRDPSFVGCQTSPTASFPSGHTNEAFTAAGVSCANHGFLPIYGSRVWDALACARDLVLATSDGLLRIMGDRHYATDVLTGGAIGFAFGYGMPTLLHYAAPKDSFLASLTVSPIPGREPGLALTGAF